MTLLDTTSARLADDHAVKGSLADPSPVARAGVEKRQGIPPGRTIPDIFPHGRLSSYTNFRCRCQDCKAAHAAYQRGHRAAAKRVPRGPILALFDAFMMAGIPRAKLARRAGVSPSFEISTQVKQTTAVRILHAAERLLVDREAELVRCRRLLEQAWESSEAIGREMTDDH